MTLWIMADRMRHRWGVTIDDGGTKVPESDNAHPVEWIEPASGASFYFTEMALGFGSRAKRRRLFWKRPGLDKPTDVTHMLPDDVQEGPLLDAASSFSRVLRTDGSTVYPDPDESDDRPSTRATQEA